MFENKQTLFVFCGLPGAGKTSIARQVEQKTGAVRLNTDEWMADLELDFFGSEQRDLLQDRLIKHGEQLLAQKLDVILEDGQWSRQERDEKVEMAKRYGARIVVYVFDLSTEELWKRLEHRNNNLTHGAIPLTRELLDSYVELFQVPSNEELRAYDEAHIYTDMTPLKLE